MLAQPQATLHLATTKSSAESVMQPRFVWVDLTRAVAMLWVVTIHVAAVPTVHFQAVPRGWWGWALAYNSLSRAAVPLFIMLSGALLLTRQPWDIGEFFRKRAAKLVAPLIAWTLLYIGWRVLLRGDQFTGTDVLRHLLNGSQHPAYPHLWFLWIIFSLYLLAPLLRSFVVHASATLHMYIAALWLVASGLLPTFARSLDLPIDLGVHPLFGFIGYFVVGASIHKFVPPRLPTRWIVPVAALFIGGVLACALGTFWRTLYVRHAIDESFLEPVAGNVMIMTLAAFLLIRHVAATVVKGNGRIPALLSFAGVVSFGTYLVHPMVIDVFDLLGLHLDPLPFHPGWYVPMLTIGVLAASAAVAAALRKTRVLAWLVP
jgi:surface polysaccharide O-acyltransferase-like enzyme